MDYYERSLQKAETLRLSQSVRILAIETSCDETAAAVVENGRVILSNAVFSQVDLHALYGGVVPEIASRSHVETLSRMTDTALKDAGMSFEEIDAVAVTQGPGLAGALLAGILYAKGLAFALDKPLIPVHHIEGHICANYLTYPRLQPPFLCLAASGGHSHLYEVLKEGGYRLMGHTTDDAAGEAFDKAARAMGLPYPGGPLLDALAEHGDPTALPLPKARTKNRYDYSFSGLKTAFVNALDRMTREGNRLPDADLAASFRQAVVDALIEKAMLAAEDTGAPALCLAGGVACNRLLRSRLAQVCGVKGLPLMMPPPELCADNAAMIGAAAYLRLHRGEIAPLTLNADPGMTL